MRSKLLYITESHKDSGIRGNSILVRKNSVRLKKVGKGLVESLYQEQFDYMWNLKKQTNKQ